ncbi:uncharacterized protein EHS24_006614 [Apiotrichum porosum]|uniref:Uncharacterized protein n=1 Tax=Apiotrichum porosum TaxID=105984 RepID=A0A427Y1R6_9TREE|nr:uncharacterized protein EHS24_006614 [Apiotrichum porosum]RSH85027.1 hypothetical protein EHS24_006614 [Apiotrichum porosum]
MGLAEALVVLTAPVDTAPMMKLEDVAFMDESLLDDTNAAQTLGKHTATTRYAPATLEPHRGSDSCSGTPEAFTPTSQKAALAALLMPPSEASAKPPASTENSLFGLASTAAGNDEDAAAAREIMLAAQQSFADHDAGRRFQPSPHIRRLHESPSLPESPTLGFENEVWRKLSNKYVRPRPPPAHFVDSDGSSSAQSSSVSEASGDEAVEELVAEYEAGALVVKAIRIEVGVPASTVSLSPIAEVSDVATPRPSTPRSVEETTVLKAATTDVSLNTPTASVYLSLPPTPEHETTTGASRMVPSDSVDSVYHLAPSSPVDRASVYVSLPNTPVASTSLSLHQPPHDERTSVYVSLPNTPELSNEDLATVTSSTLGLSHTSLNITPPTPENGSPMTPHEECFSTAPEAVLTAEAALDTFLTPVDGKPEQWVTAPTTPAETGPREAYSVSTTPTSPASPTTPRGSMPPLPESATSPVMQQAALSRSAPGSIRRSKRDSTGPPTTIAARRLTPPMFPPPSRSIPSTPPYPPASNLRSASFSSSPKAAAQRRFVTSPTASTFAEAMATTTKPLPTTPPPVTPPTPAAALPRTPGKTPKSSPRAQAPPSPEPATLGEFMGLFRNIRRREEGVSLRDAVRKAERRSGFFQGVEAAQS